MLASRNARPTLARVPLRRRARAIRIFNLTSAWDTERVADLQDNLARLISPFSNIEDFTIRLTAQQVGEESSPVEIASPGVFESPALRYQRSCGFQRRRECSL